MTREQIAAIDGARTALALTGHAPFGDCQSIRHRLDAARAQARELEESINIFSGNLPPGDTILSKWMREVRVWKYAIQEGEKLLARELKNPKSR